MFYLENLEKFYFLIFLDQKMNFLKFGFKFKKSAFQYENFSLSRFNLLDIQNVIN